METIEKCSCRESAFLRVALEFVKRVATTDTRQSEMDDLVDIQRFALMALDTREPGGEPPCSCEESRHLRNALWACVNVARDGEGSAEGQPIHDVAQCSNFADQGLKLADIVGDPGVYDARRFIPGTIEEARHALRER